MSEQTVTGLSCPRCGGIVPVPEGQAIVICPYCDQRSVVSAEASAAPQEARADEHPIGVRRYQAPLRTTREQAIDALRGFLNGKIQVARDAAKESQVSEVFLVHLPFWAVWGRGVAWAFGQVQVGSGDDKRYEPREKKAVKELSWNAPACEVGEFGVRQVSLDGCPLEPFDAAGLHRSGMVFEPVGSTQAALEAARQEFAETVKREVRMERTEQTFTRLINVHLGLVYYPLWVVRYLYRGRSFQVVVDGFNGQILYGKAPGSVAYRAAVLVGGMAAGAVLAIDVPALLMLSSSSDEDSPFLIALFLFLFGLGIMWWAYRTFRHAEHYEYHRYGKKMGVIPTLTTGLPGDLGKAVSALEKFS